MNTPSISPQNKKDDAEFPPELSGWNWGAFLLGPVWAIYHRVWIGLCCLIPCAGVFFTFYLGLKGNQLAWKSRQWSSAEEFRKTQRLWIIGSLLFYTVIILSMVWFLSTANFNLQVR